MPGTGGHLYPASDIPETDSEMPSVTITEEECARCADATADSFESGTVCETCTESLAECIRCDQLVEPQGTYRVFARDSTVNRRVCGECVVFYTECYHCVYYTRDGGGNQFTRYDGETICEDCRFSRYWSCDSCDTLISDGNYCSDCDRDDDDCSCGYCSECDPPSDSESDLVYDYSFKPHPEFHGEGPVFLGLELEIETRYDGLHEAASLATRAMGSVGYLKEDSSIDHGFEIVTHPMSYAYAMQSFPWEMLPGLDGMGCDAGGNGLHVHVSRAGFSGPVHIYRWLKFFHRNRDQVTTIARRKSDEWAAFHEHDRQNAKEYAKGNRCARRYSAINVLNEATLELRIFASSLTPQEVQAALGLAAASVEYTRTLTAHEVAANGGWEWAAFAGWVATRPEYAPLAREMESLACAS